MSPRTVSPRMGLGAALLAGAAIILIVAILIGWGATTRWLGIADVHQARARLLHAPDQAARAAADAAQALPDEPAAVLLTIDLQKAEDYTRLEDLERRSDSRHGELIRTGMALSQVLRDQTPPQVGGADGALLAVLAALRSGSPPAPLPTTAGEAPRLSVLSATLAAQWRAAVAAGDAALARQAAGALAMLQPRHPSAPLLWFAAGALDPSSDRARLQTLAQKVPQAQLAPLARALSRLAPSRSSELDALALGLAPSLTPAQMLEAQVRAAVGGADVQVSPLARRCLEAGRPDLAKQLLPRLPASAQAPFQRFILLNEGDMAELAKAGEQTPELMPRITPPRIRPGSVAFHLSNAAGAVPKGELTIRLDGKAIEAARVMRLGSLIVIDTQKQTGPTDFEVRAGERTLHASKVTL